jgi:outer membrane protein OmpA-like peptidoglycan-associated protein
MPCHVCTSALLIVCLCACAPMRQMPGALAPVHARTTNGILAADLATIDAWEARRIALLRNDGADLSSRGITLARAGAWLAFAREAYVAHPRAQDADEALTEARRLLESLSSTRIVATVPAAPASLLATAQKLSPELWARVRELESGSGAAQNIATLADAEIELVRAAAARAPVSIVELPANPVSMSGSGGALACSQSQHVARAGRLLLPDATEVRLAGDTRLTAPEELRQNARTVHFALASDVLHDPSAALLAGVADAMRQHPEVSLVIEGHADPRGADTSNLWLSGRRAEGVRELLVHSGVDGNRVLVRMFGARHRDASGTSVLDYARDRRVQLRFVLPDGTELTAMADASDLQIESEKLWSGAQRPGLRRFVAEPGSTVVAPPVPVALRKARKSARRVQE